MQRDKLAIEVAFADHVVIDERDRADARACYGLGDKAADAADTEYRDVRILEPGKAVLTQQHDLSAELLVHKNLPDTAEAAMRQLLRR